MDIIYEQNFALPTALRPELKGEVTFEDPSRSPIDRPLTSLITNLTGGKPEVANFPCIDPIETAADKISALVWRILTRDRTSSNDDPTLVRHLHDLAALADLAKSDPQFALLARQNLEADFKTSAKDADMAVSIEAQLDKVSEILAHDGEYRTEYESFVTEMSYADDAERIDFDPAVEAYRDLIERLKGSDQ